MLERLALNNVGPAPEMALDFRPRVNLITGDNGLGKSFLLDVAWWALTRRWPREVNRRMTSGFPARPHDPEREASITFRVRGKTVTTSYTATFSKPDQAWIGGPGRPAIPGLVVYAHADGSFSVWDPARNYWTQPVNSDVPERRPAYVFTEEEVWDGLRDDVNGRSVPVCNGLLYDWSTWIQAHDDNARGMASALLALSPSQEPNESITPGPPMRLSVDDARDIPTIETGYAGSVPILHASSGVRRAVALAYMLTWTWSEHKVTARMRGEEPSAQIVMLFDEVESHLHPHWQRSILRCSAQSRVRTPGRWPTPACRVHTFAPGDGVRRTVVRPTTGRLVRPRPARRPAQDAIAAPCLHTSRHDGRVAYERSLRPCDGPQPGRGTGDSPRKTAAPPVRAAAGGHHGGPRQVGRNLAGHRPIPGAVERVRREPGWNTVIRVAPACEPGDLGKAWSAALPRQSRGPLSACVSTISNAAKHERSTRRHTGMATLPSIT